MFTRQLQPHHHATILFLIIFFAFVTCEVLSLSLSLSGSGSLSQIRSSGVMELESSKYNTQIQGPSFARIHNSKPGCSQRWPKRQQQRQCTSLYMTTADDSNKNGDHADDKDLSSSSSNNVPFFEEPNEQSKKAMSDEQNKKKNTTMTVILTIPLFIKFFAVLCIKFLTDAVVFPSLFLYRILRKTKRKIISLFQQGPASIKPNGATPVDKK
jgi:hypothetical protein